MNKMRVTHEVDEINAILNSPGCREEHFPPGHLELHPKDQHDMTDIIRRGGFMVVGDRMGWIFNRVDVGTYEGHTAIMQEKRGPGFMAYFREAISTAFLGTDCMEILTRCATDNHDVNIVAKRCGFRKLYVAEGIWGGQDMNVWSLPLSAWAAKAHGFETQGKWLHEEFERNKALHEKHEDHGAHLQYAGIALEMGLRGQPHKGAFIYNIWATMNMYGQVQIMCTDPLIMRTGWYTDTEKKVPAIIDYKVTQEGLERL